MEPKLVPNVFPKVPSPLKIALIGEAPGADEEAAGVPFVGQSGKFLDRLLAKQGVLRDSCFLGNVCQVRPPTNQIDAFKPDGPEITYGRAKLAEDLAKFQPNVCLLLGKTALWAAKGVYNISDWRGSLFMSSSLWEGEHKCIASFHPAFALRDYSVTPILTLDISRAIQESREPALVLPERQLCINQSYEEVLTSLHITRELKKPIAIDIEGGVQDMSCISVAGEKDSAFIVPFSRLDGSSYWESEEEEYQIWTALAELLGDPKVPKILQNSLYDRFVLQYAHNIVVRNVADDTMLKHWELYCELEKSLGFQASIHTRQPYYKSDRKTDDQDTFYRYCCMDSCVTFEINEVLNKYLNPGQVNHYKANMELLNPLLYMELRGIRYDHKKAKARYAEVMEKVYEVQHELDLLAQKDGVLQAIDFSQPKEGILKQMESFCGLKKDPTKPKKTFADDGYYETKAKLMGSIGDIPTDLKGEISMLCKATLNTKSHKKFQSYLYETCKLPKQWKKDPKTRELKLTTDYEALLKLSKSEDHPALRLAIELSRCRTRSQMLSILPINGRMHCNYQLCGSETGRVTSSKSNLYVFDEDTGKSKKVGANLQTMPNDWELDDPSHPLSQGMRDLFLADEGCYMAKCDLEGADGWTIGAYMASLGDPTMLEDLKAKLKPARVIAYGLRYGKESIRGKSREELKKLVECIKKDDWEYFVSKALLYGFCLTGDHEVLTPSGWIPLEHLWQDQPVATWNGETRAITFEKPKRIIRQIYSGHLYGFEGTSMSLLATADHRMPYYSNGKLHERLAKDMFGKSCVLPLSGHWIWGTKTEPNARLIAAIMSDGHYTKHGRLNFCFRKPRKIKRIQELLRIARIKFRVSKHRGARGQWNTHIWCDKATTPVYPKAAGVFMLEWDEQSLKEFLDEYPKWDGTLVKNSKIRLAFSKDKEHLDWLCTFARLTNQGYTYYGHQVSGFGSRIHKIGFNRRQFAFLPSMKQTKKLANFLPVYCVEVSTGLFLVRRNNKISVTGNCYGMGPRKASESIFIQSEGKVKMTERDIKALQEIVRVRYNYSKYHDHFARFASSQQYPCKLAAPNGFVRTFFSRNYGERPECLGEILAHMPQVVTTWTTNSALHKLWVDPTNRVSRGDWHLVGPLAIEPLHQVHDEIVVQWRQDQTDWAKQKIHEWFQTPITLRGINLIVPFDGSIGTNWSMDEEAKVGTL